MSTATHHHDPLQLMTIAEVSRLTRRHRNTIAKEIKAGRLQKVMLGNRIRIPRQSVVDYLVAAGFPADPNGGEHE